jgi:hypothetical protein
MRKGLILVPLLALAACHGKVDISDQDGNTSEGNVHIAMGDAAGDSGNVSVDAPGFKARVSLPSINLGDNLDLDGIKIAPNTKIGGMNVDAQDKGGNDNGSGTVQLTFTNPAPPATVIDHYARSAADAGYGQISRSGSSMAAKKGDKSFALDIAPDGNGSRGTIVLSGKGEN